MKPEDDKTEQAPEASAPSAPSLPSEVEAAIERWWADHFHNLGPRLETSLYNHFNAAKDRLKAELARLL